MQYRVPWQCVIKDIIRVIKYHEFLIAIRRGHVGRWMNTFDAFYTVICVSRFSIMHDHVCK